MAIISPSAQNYFWPRQHKRNLPSCLKQPKNKSKNKNRESIWNKSFQDIGHQTTKDSDHWRMADKWGKPWDCPSYCPRLLINHCVGKGELRQSLVFSLYWGIGAKSPGRSRQLEFTGHHTVRKEQEREGKRLREREF